MYSSLTGTKKYVLIAVSILSILALGLMYYFCSFSIQIEADGTVLTQKHLFPITVQTILEEQGLSLETHDVAQPSLSTYLSADQTVRVIRAIHAFVAADGQLYPIVTIPISAAEAIRLAGVELKDQDFIENETIAPIQEGQVLHVVRVMQNYEQIEYEVPYTTVMKTDANLEYGLQRIVQPGQSGWNRDTVRVTFYDGKEVSRHVVSSEAVREMCPQIVAEGQITNVSRSGRRIDFYRAYEMLATGYTYTGDKTASGIDPSVGYVAVDPTIIPLGSRLYIDGYGFATAADTGRLIQGNRVDLFYETEEECYRWGSRPVKVFLLR